MHFSLPRCSGRADPLGLLVLAVMLAFAVTIGVQAQAGLDAADARPHARHRA